MVTFVRFNHHKAEITQDTLCNPQLRCVQDICLEEAVCG